LIIAPSSAKRKPSPVGRVPCPTKTIEQKPRAPCHPARSLGRTTAEHSTVNVTPSILTGVMLRCLGAVLVACCVLLGCAPPSRRSPAVPVANDDGSGTRPRWDSPRDTACDFPKEADAAKIDAARVVLRVLVNVDGSPQAVDLLEDPGFGFGHAASRCALARAYAPGTDDDGAPIPSWTPPFTLRFMR
jgi:hypothetical protein